MANMSYCKFRNTLEDLKDCIETINDPSDIEEEEAARKKLIATCRKIASEAEEDGGVKTELTKGDIQKYVEDGGCSCPFCGHDDIVGEDVTSGSGTASQEMSCPECNARWNDVYDLVGIEVIEAPEGGR